MDRMNPYEAAALGRIPLIGAAPVGYVEYPVDVPFGDKDCHLYEDRVRSLRLLTSIDGGYLHASISHPSRHPTWEEIKEVRNWFFPAEMEVVMVLARKSGYVNVHQHCFHLWESYCGQEGR